MGGIVTDDPSRWQAAPVWREWLQLTRLQWSGRIAFETELRRWNDPFLAGGDKLSVRISDCGGEYETSFDNHLVALRDVSQYCGLILVKSWALLEGHAKLVAHLDLQGRLADLFDRGQVEDLAAADDHILAGGVEAWGSDLLRRVGQDWDKVFEGQAGLVEVSLVRNAVAHGRRHATEALIQSARARSAEFPYATGEEIVLDFDRLHNYRGRIRSFCRIVCDGALHLSRGTHKELRV